jgi:hypothetical protein
MFLQIYSLAKTPGELVIRGRINYAVPFLYKATADKIIFDYEHDGLETAAPPGWTHAEFITLPNKRKIKIMADQAGIISLSAAKNIRVFRALLAG